jgi:hypothetical protein
VVDELSLTVIFPPTVVVTVKPERDRLLTVPEVPPGSLVVRALDPWPEPPPAAKGPRAPFVLVPLGEAVVVLLGEPEVETRPMGTPATTTTAIPAVIAMFRLREKNLRFLAELCGGTGCTGAGAGPFAG